MQPTDQILAITVPTVCALWLAGLPLYFTGGVMLNMAVAAHELKRHSLLSFVPSLAAPQLAHPGRLGRPASDRAGGHQACNPTPATLCIQAARERGDPCGGGA